MSEFDNVSTSDLIRDADSIAVDLDEAAHSENEDNMKLDGYDLAKIWQELRRRKVV